MNKSKIKKGIVRCIQAKQYEPVTITVEIEEEIEWENSSDRTKKTDIITTRLIEDFKKTYNEVIEVLGVDRCIGTVKTREDKLKEDKIKEDKPSNKDSDLGDDLFN